MTREVGTLLVPLPAAKLSVLISVIFNGPLGTVISGGCQLVPDCALPFMAVQETPVPLGALQL